MSNFSSAVLSLTPYHLLAYGTLLGTELYQVRKTALEHSGIPPENPYLFGHVQPLTYQSELCHDQSMFPSTADGPVHGTPEESLPSVLQDTSGALGYPGFHAPADESAIPGQISSGLCAAGDRFGSLDTKPDGIWTTDRKDHGGKVSSA